MAWNQEIELRQPALKDKNLAIGRGRQYRGLAQGSLAVAGSASEDLTSVGTGWVETSTHLQRSFVVDSRNLVRALVAPAAVAAAFALAGCDGDSLSTNAKDPQTGKSVPAPIVEVDNGKLSGQVQAWSAQWNHQSFNQGSPKPGGTSP